MPALFILYHSCQQWLKVPLPKYSALLPLPLKHCQQCLFTPQGSFCPTTCGIADFLSKYHPTVENDLQEMERLLQRISNATVTADHLIQHIQGLYPSEKQTLPSEHIKIRTQLKNIMWFSFFFIFSFSFLHLFCTFSISQIRLMISLKSPGK